MLIFPFLGWYGALGVKFAHASAESAMFQMDLGSMQRSVWFFLLVALLPLQVFVLDRTAVFQWQVHLRGSFFGLLLEELVGGYLSPVLSV